MDALEIDYLADRPEFLRDLAAWLHGEWRHLYPGATMETRTRNLRIQMRRDAIPFTIVAHENGKPVGTAALIDCDLETRPHLKPWLASVFVPPEHRRRGIAARLVTRVTDIVRTLEYDECFLWTDKEAAYYANMGRERQFEENHRGGRIVVMRYPIDAEPTQPARERRRSS
ncbi:MAG: GNAT family N-acetyltransferase [Planctomycetota bacterium]|nr:GNAT family N-acetyltransferase [Planctomycetota bacterium]